MAAGRPLRNLAAWGYMSAKSGTRVEVDVWTINRAGATDDAIERAREAMPGNVEVVDAVGNVARVIYPNLGTEGYRYIDMAETNPGKDEPADATQQAFAGAVRVAGGQRTETGQQKEGFTSADDAPGIDEVVAYGEAEVMPVVRGELRELGLLVEREPSRDEENEPVTDRPFSGLKNVVRVFPHGSDSNPWRYQVRGEQLVRLSKGEQVTTAGSRRMTK